MGYTYCMADIHGEYDRFAAMLERIGFGDGDVLYVLGDAIDRGKRGVEVLREIMRRPNVRMLLGNHEQMCLDTLGPYNDPFARQVWQQNGGSPTRRDLLYRVTPAQRTEVLRFLLRLPEYAEVQVGQRSFYLVHGAPAENREGRIWGRPEPDAPAPFADKTVIVGHTPTSFLAGEDDRPLRIWHGNGIIDVDCGCGHSSERARLACLRLDDMAEFYV